MQVQQSPLITKMSWGSITVEVADKDGTIRSNQTISYRDAKLWPGGSRAWDWRETGTGHVNGIQIADLTDLIEHNPQTIVLTRGVLSVLNVPQKTINHIQSRHPDIKVIVETTKKAHQTYNSLVREGKRVAALIHTTC